MIEQYATDPESLRNNVKALKGEPGYLRLCIGDWRGGIFRGHEIVAIIEVAPRGSAY